VLPIELPCAHAAINGELVAVADDKSVHVVPVPCQSSLGDSIELHTE
jgi:hypothetical protein